MGARVNFRGDRRITINTAPTGSSGIGEPTTAGTEVCTVWAEYRPASGREINASGRDVSEVFDTFRIRYRTDLDETMQLLYGADTYEIHRIVEIGRREGLELTCRRIR